MNRWKGRHYYEVVLRSSWYGTCRTLRNKSYWDGWSREFLQSHRPSLWSSSETIRELLVKWRRTGDVKHSDCGEIRKGQIASGSSCSQSSDSLCESLERTFRSITIETIGTSWSIASRGDFQEKNAALFAKKRAGKQSCLEKVVYLIF